MKRLVLATLVLPLLLLGRVQPASAHCEVPCGIFHDQLRFEQMLEDQTTIAKAMAQITELSKTMEQGVDPLSVNQMVRWVTTKEAHAVKTQEVIAQYFMAQRIKPGTDEETQKAYLKKLVAAHAVMQAAMKCKQTVDPAAADALKEAIYNFYRAYEGKEPQLHD